MRKTNISSMRNSRI
ncbi:hypothetical protein CP8484711_1903A, partial [Chlamydia psittaci 84-8471/1]